VTSAPAPSRAAPTTGRPVGPVRTAGGDSLTPEGLLVAIGLGAVAVLALWWHDTTQLSGFGDDLTNAGRVTGLLAGYAIAVLLLLMARIPALEHGVGADRLARWHSMGGRYTVGLASAHAVLIIWGYAVSAHQGVVHQTGTLLTSYPDVLMATVALGLLLGVGAVSARAARRRMRYETWYYLHFYTYLATALAFSHQFADGADFLASRSARAAWAALYIGVAAALLWFRFLTPVRSALRHRMRVQAVIPESPGVFSVLIAGDHLDELSARPGQFFRWRFLTRDEWWASHPFSLSAPPHQAVLRITVKELGRHTAGVRALRPGTRVFAEGPYGALTAARQRQRRVVLVAGGVGIAPLRALFETLPASSGDLTLIYRASRPKDVLFRHELDAIAAARGARVHYLVGPRGGENDPLLPGRLERLVPGLSNSDAYVCGPPGLTTAAVTALRAAGVPGRRIHTESFTF
jgi:predicted ferric reductase